MCITLNLEEAAEFLKMNIETVRRLAQDGRLPAAKPGKRWVFIQEDLASWLRSLYSQPRRALLSETTTGGKLCHSSNAVRRGGSTSPHRAESELSVLLRQP
ncbi:MAG TPA: DNA-binding protein [Methylophaga sp.]|nr:DNA-binding protein [Methylophaga sp.]HEC58753.1 DNA-binding protein [Methylophaga sp.]